MSEISHSDELVTKQDLSNFYQGILPYLGGIPEMLANKFSKGDLYSTDEKMIGQWIDGRPLYQKTVVVNSPASAGVDTIVTSFDATTQPREMIGLLDNTIPLNYNGTNEWYVKTRLEPSFSNSVLTGINIRMIVAGYTNRVTRITVRYTKTTDSAINIGSEGDYSTTEKIVGTWIDGKPIYQKTFNATTPSTALSNEDIVTHGLSIGTVVSIKGIVIKTDTNGKYYWDINSVIGSPTSYNGDMRACWVRPNTIAMKVSDGATNLPVIITLQYTKSN